ncbi:MAG: class I SAM-dependent methyltransferase, partial [Balneolaceae bacterium]
IEQRFVEIHKQKIYNLDQIHSIARKTDYQIQDYYDGFTLKKADNKSLRITMILQWQKTK